jgi:hypothetical protein
VILFDANVAVTLLQANLAVQFQLLNVSCVIAVKAVLMHNVALMVAAVAVLSAVTIILFL